VTKATPNFCASTELVGFYRSVRACQFQHSIDENVDQFAVFLELVVFHPAVIEVRVEGFGGFEPSEEDGLFYFISETLDELRYGGVFLSAYAPAVHFSDSDVGRCAPEFFRRLENVVGLVFAISIAEELLRQVCVFGC